MVWIRHEYSYFAVVLVTYTVRLNVCEEKW